MRKRKQQSAGRAGRFEVSGLSERPDRNGILQKPVNGSVYEHVHVNDHDQVYVNVIVIVGGFLNPI